MLMFLKYLTICHGYSHIASYTIADTWTVRLQLFPTGFGSKKEKGNYFSTLYDAAQCKYGFT